MLPKMRLETYERSMPCYDNSEIFYWINYHNDIIYGTLLDVAVVFECCCYGARVSIHGTAGHTMFVIIQSICLPQWLSTWAMPQCGVLSTSTACHNCFRSTCMCVSYLAVPVRCDGGECVVRAPASIYCITRIECMWISSFTAAPKDCRSDLFVAVFIICLRSRVRSNATRHSTIVSREMNNVREVDKIGKWVCGLAGKQQSMPIALNFPIDSFQCRNYFRSNCKLYAFFNNINYSAINMLWIISISILLVVRIIYVHRSVIVCNIMFVSYTLLRW